MFPNVLEMILEVSTGEVLEVEVHGRIPGVPI